MSTQFLFDPLHANKVPCAWCQPQWFMGKPLSDIDLFVFLDIGFKIPHDEEPSQQFTTVPLPLFIVVP